MVIASLSERWDGTVTGPPGRSTLIPKRPPAVKDSNTCDLTSMGMAPLDVNDTVPRVPLDVGCVFNETVFSSKICPGFK